MLAGAAAGELDLVVTTVDYASAVPPERAVAPLLSRLHAVYEDWLGLVLPPTLPLEVVMVDDAELYQAREKASGEIRHTSGFFEPQLRRVTVWRRGNDVEARSILVHEVSHFMLDVAGMSKIPAWLQEGMAVVGGTAMLDDEGVVWLVPDLEVTWVTGRPRPSASALIGLDPAVWAEIGPTPWRKPVYPYGGSLCAFLMQTDAGRRTLGELLASTAVSADPGRDALDAVERRYPGGLAALDQAWADWEPARIQLPIRATGSTSDGWGRCVDGSLVRLGSGATCSRWVAGPDGLMRYVEEAPLR